jgi:dTMP kinase
MHPEGGRFVTVEGIEGAGKSTHLRLVSELLGREGREVVVTREPGGTELGEEVRALVLGHRQGGMSADAELLLMFAARAEHLDRVIRPALAAGKWVVCDRFTDATFAYQGGGRGVARERIAELARWTHGGFGPALTLLLDVPAELGLERAGKRGSADRFESERIEFFHRVRASYAGLARHEPGRFRVIDASPPLAAVAARVRETMEQWLSTRQ